MNAIDTNVIAYLFDPASPQKQAKARQLFDELVLKPQETILLWQVAVEFLACLRKAKNKGLLTDAEVQVNYREVLQLFALQLPTAKVLELSFILHDRYSLSHWDSLLLAACQDAGVSRFYSEDMQHGVDYGGVTVVNLFV